MFVPIHRRCRRDVPGPVLRRARIGGIFIAVLTSLAAWVIATVMDVSRPRHSGDYVVLALLVAVVAVAGGFAVAKAIGRHGKM